MGQSSGECPARTASAPMGSGSPGKATARKVANGPRAKGHTAHMQAESLASPLPRARHCCMPLHAAR
eukprot:15451616-Alexandrium_andersonii.AAC.1